MSRLDFPRSDRPVVSIVIVTFGAREVVAAALRYLRRNTDVPFELILVDNASPDDTPDWVAAHVGGVQLLRNPVNRGFGPASNQGAALATGRHVLFLNSDVFVRRGWLEPLVERMDEDPACVAVGPRLLNLDGTLQEAGALLFRNGHSQLHGLGDDPWKADYGFARAVDYASAACLLVRRRVFLDVGGFDPVFAPAYFEDVDLCLRLARAGGRVVFEPRSAVTHVRGASAESARALALWSRNEPVFAARWIDELEARPRFAGPDGSPWLRRAARDFRSALRILAVLTVDSGTRGVARTALARLARVHGLRVSVLAEDPVPAHDDTARLLAAGIEVESLSGDLEARLGERAFAYDLVLVDGQIRPALRQRLLATQPQVEECGETADLAALGVCPEAQIGYGDPR